MEDGNDQANYQEAMQAFFAVAGDAPLPETPVASPEVPAAPEVKAAEPTTSEVSSTEVKPTPEVVSAPEVAAPAPTPDVKKLMDQEAAILARETKLKEAETDIRSLYEQLQAFERAKAEFRRDPAAFIRALDPELAVESVAEQLYHEAIGDKAPLEYQVKKQTTGVERRVDDLEKRLEERERAIAAREQEQEVRAYRSQLAAQASALDEKSHPMLSGLAKRNADRFAELMFEAARKTAIETNGAKVLTPVEAAAAAEAYLVKQHEELYGPAPTAAKEQPKPPSSQVTTWNTATAVQPGKVPADPDDDRALRAAALKGAGLGHVPVW